MASLIGRIRNQGPAQQNAPVQYAPSGQYRYPLMGGVSTMDTYLRAYQNNGTIYSVVNLLARSSAQVNWSLLRTTHDGRVRYAPHTDIGSDQRVEVLNHQALKVFHHPNDYMSRHDLIYLTQTHLELTGEAYWLVVYTGTTPSALWPVLPSRMTPVPGKTKFLDGWVYTSPDGEQVPLDVNEVLQLKYTNPSDIYRGLGPVQAILDDAHAAKYAAEYNRNFFINSAQPDGIIQVPNAVTDEQFTELTNRWRESHQGTSRAHHIAILENGMTWTPASSTMRDMEFATLRTMSRDIIREAWGVHKIMIGNSDDVNRANAITGEQVHIDWQVVPRLNLIRNVLNKRFLPLFGATGENVEFDYHDLKVNDPDTATKELVGKSQAAAMLIGAGFEPHDVLQAVGLPDMEVAVPPTAPPVLAPPAPAHETLTQPQQDDNSDEMTNRLRKVLMNGHLPVEVCGIKSI